MDCSHRQLLEKRVNVYLPPPSFGSAPASRYDVIPRRLDHAPTAAFRPRSSDRPAAHSSPPQIPVNSRIFSVAFRPHTQFASVCHSGLRKVSQCFPPEW